MLNIKILIDVYNVYFKKYTSDLLLYLCIKSIGSVLILIPPILLGKIIDFILNKNLRIIYIVLVLIFSVNFMINIIGVIENKLRIKISNSIEVEIKSAVLHKILYLRIYDLENMEQGEYMSRIEDVNHIIDNYINIINTIFSDILSFLISTIIMFKISPILSFVCILNFVVTFYIQNIFSENISKVQKKYKKYIDDYYTILSKILSNIKEIKKLNIENKIKKIYNRNLLNNINTINKKNNISIKSSFVFGVINNVFNVILMLISSMLIIYKIITVGNYITFNSYIAKFNYGLSKLCTLNFDIKMLDISLERLNQIMKLDDEIKISLNKNNLTDNKFDIIIEDLKFSYDKSDNYNLNIDKLLLKHNSLNVIIGKNGCGKTTLVNLLMNFYDYNGNIKINNIDINNISVFSLREKILYINQNMLVFNMSIEENLKLINEHITQEEMEKACKKLELHDYILGLEHKYKTILNDNNLFSSGQLQRLSIARALLSERNIIIFDESNSFLDVKGHKLFNDILQEISIKNTVILITHKLKYINDKSQIIIMDNGKIIEMGNHVDLLKNSKRYKEFLSH